MTADTVEELHAFATKAGIPRHWFHLSRKGVPHYDLNPKNRELAIATHIATDWLKVMKT